MSLAVLANHMASKGRNGDSMLVHMSPDEVRALQALAERHGKTLTINPETGQPEAFSLKSLLPMIAGLALGPAGFGLMSAGMAGLTVGGITALATGDISRGLMAGLGAYGGAGLGEALMGAGSGAAQQAAMSGLTQDEIARRVAEENLANMATSTTSQGVVNQAAADAATNFAKSSTASQMGAGLEAITKSPEAFGQFAKDNWKTLAAATVPAVLAGESVKTTTQMPDGKQSPAYIRPKRFDPYTQQMISYEPILASEFGNRRMSDYTSGDGTPGSASGLAGLSERRPAGMAQGGIVALAEGGTPGGVVTPGSVEDLYRKYAGRGSDPEGLKYWQQQFGDTIDPNEINVFKTAVAEARGLGTEPVDVTRAQANTLVENMYRNVLNRDAEQSGLNYWADMIQTSNDPTKVYQDFLTAAKAGTELGKFGMGYEQAVTPYTGYTSADTGTNADEWVRNVLGREVTAADRNQQWYKDMAGVTDVSGAKAAYSDFLRSTGATTDLDWMAASQLAPLKNTTPTTYAPPGTKNPYGNVVTPGDKTINADGSITVQPNIPGRPYGGFTGMQQVKDAYTAGGGSLGYTPYAPKTLQEFQDRYTTSGGSKQAYDYLMNKGATDIKRPITKTGALMLPYADVMGLRRQIPAGARTTAVAEDVAESAANGGVMRMALGGLGALAAGGETSRYNLGSYSDGGRLLRGPGDGVSDSIPATIGDKQPARLADGEFVVPARIVSELGNGSTEAGARKLYAMMDRVQKARGKTTGKGKVAKDTSADKYLPA